MRHPITSALGTGLLLGFIILNVSGCVGVAASRDQWQEEILLQLSELRKGQGELRQQVTDLAAQVQALESAGKPAPVSIDLRNGAYPAMGNAAATVAIVEFSDFECPFCRRHQQNTLPGLTAKYLDAGKARYVFVNLPLGFHASAEPAAIAGACAHQQGAFWKMREGLFANQNALNQSTFLKLAGDLGLNSDRFSTCLRDPAVAVQVRAQAQFGESIGVQGTPAFFIGRVRDGVLTDATLVSGAQPLAAFERVIDPLLAEGGAQRP